jgi:U3 small nucleolar RNA-associated protein 5
MTWIQWTLVAHGGAIASQPKVLHGLSGLQKVLAERSKGLSSLLALKGKLDMLESQMDLRKRMQQSTRKAQGEVDEDEEEEDVIWVEGETNDNGTHSKRRALEDDEDDMAPTANGFLGESDDDDESDAEEEDDDDEEAVELLDEDEVDHEDVDDSMAEDDESDAEPAPPAKVQKVSRAFSKRV